jgi:hypothetical protein
MGSMRRLAYAALAMVVVAAAGCSFDTSGQPVNVTGDVGGGGDGPGSDMTPSEAGNDSPVIDSRGDGPVADHLLADMPPDQKQPDMSVPDMKLPDMKLPDMMPPDMMADMMPDACPTGSIICAGMGCVAQSFGSCGCPAAACSVDTADSCGNANGCRCGTGAACSGGLKCCSGNCVDPSMNGNCGACGVTCGTGFTCGASAGTFTCGCNQGTNGNADCSGIMLAPRCATLGFNVCECGYGNLHGCDSATSDHCSGTGNTDTCLCGTNPACTGGLVCKGATCVSP